MTTQHPDAALDAIPLIINPGNEYHASTRQWQGIPSIERTRDGVFWATWYTGGKTEDPDNYSLIVRSDDEGETWSEPVLVVDPPGKVRAFDPTLWTDPLGRLWFFWAQSYELFDGRVGVWMSHCSDPAAEHPQWSEPRRLCNGIMLNKPTVLSSGEWLFPTALWAPSGWMKPDHPAFGAHPDLDEERLSTVYVTRDQGETFELLGRADVPERVFDEHMVVERRDGSLWMLVRTLHGIGESVSLDRGMTWSPGQDSGLGGPCSRFFIRRLQSGRLLLINHYEFTGRNNLTAMLSDDDGATWPHRLLLDERKDVSYPDGIQAPDGMIHVIYDRERYGAKEILLASFTEEDVVAGEVVSPASRLRRLVSKVK